MKLSKSIDYPILDNALPYDNRVWLAREIADVYVKIELKTGEILDGPWQRRRLYLDLSEDCRGWLWCFKHRRTGQIVPVVATQAAEPR